MPAIVGDRNALRLLHLQRLGDSRMQHLQGAFVGELEMWNVVVHGVCSLANYDNLRACPTSTSGSKTASRGSQSSVRAAMPSAARCLRSSAQHSGERLP